MCIRHPRKKKRDMMIQLDLGPDLMSPRVDTRFQRHFQHEWTCLPCATPPPPPPSLSPLSLCSSMHIWFDPDFVCECVRYGEYVVHHDMESLFLSFSLSLVPSLSFSHSLPVCLCRCLSLSHAHSNFLILSLFLCPFSVSLSCSLSLSLSLSLSYHVLMKSIDVPH